MVRAALGFLLLVLSALPAWADFCMLTQNGLRLGHGEDAYREAKRQGFRRIFQDYDEVALQEVMDPDEAVRLAPEGFEAAVSTAKGRGSYREHYAILTRRGAVRVLGAAEYPDPSGAFSRPPFAVAVADREGGRYWLVDIHVVFGKGGAAPRRQEVAAMAEVLAHYAARPLPDGSTIEKVMVAGDWNLPVTDAAFEQLRAVDPALSAAPEVKSSLNAEGRPASSYDHFLWSRERMGVSFADDPRDTGGLATDVYRGTLSDHVGIAGYVSSAPGKAPPKGAACPPVRVGS
ncbi:MAG: hypothetical protein NVV74_02990 [Magnetospirillum sp.]|nr:hypothetical protein [Magnetospirillum sp.]